MNAANTRMADWLRWLGATSIASIAVLRALTSFAPEIYFDVDPMHHFAALAALSPAGSLTLDVLLLIMCAAAIVGDAKTGRRIESRLFVLALLPGAVVLWHGWHDLGDLWRGSTWLASAIALVTLAHLARQRSMRIGLFCVLIAIIGPLVVRGIGQVTFEHTATIAEFEHQRAQFFAQRGWEADSAAAQIYERRLRQPQPTGWFTTTNIFGSVMAVGAVTFAGFLLGSWRDWKKKSGMWLGAFIACAVLSLVGLYYTGSKGAMLVAMGGLTLLAAYHAMRRRPYPNFFSITLIALIPLALLGVALRGMVLPESFLGDRSLLFRWHYFVSAFDVFRSAPVLGVGPDGFQDVYTRFRLPRNPEEVMSAHSVFIDWLCMLGAVAMSWILLVFNQLWRAGRQAGHGEQLQEPVDVLPTVNKMILGVAVCAIVPAVLIEWHVLDDLHLFLRIIGGVMFVAVAVVAGVGAQHISERALRSIMAIAATLVLVHGQIEMTFFDPGAVLWAMCLLGVAGARSDATPSSARAMPSIFALLIAGIAIWIGVTGARPASEQQSRIREAAAMLHPAADSVQERVHQRERGAEWLLRAYESLPTNIHPLYAAIRQYEIAAADLHGDARVEILSHALAVADRAVASHRHVKALGERAAVNWQLAMVTGESHHLDTATTDLRQLTALDPHGITPWLKLGNVLWLTGRQDEAIRAYERVLENDANFELDPLKQLSPKQREVVERRINSQATR